MWNTFKAEKDKLRTLEVPQVFLKKIFPSQS